MGWLNFSSVLRFYTSLFLARRRRRPGLRRFNKLANRANFFIFRNQAILGRAAAVAHRSFFEKEPEKRSLGNRLFVLRLRFVQPQAGYPFVACERDGDGQNHRGAPDRLSQVRAKAQQVEPGRDQLKQDE
jgi:hypothetical protein